VRFRRFPVSSRVLQVHSFKCSSSVTGRRLVSFWPRAVIWRESCLRKKRRSPSSSCHLHKFDAPIGSGFSRPLSGGVLEGGASTPFGPQLQTRAPIFDLCLAFQPPQIRTSYTRGIAIHDTDWRLFGRRRLADYLYSPWINNRTMFALEPDIARTCEDIKPNG
jgi:hypothetical protein